MANKKRAYIRRVLAIFWLIVTAWLFYNMQAKDLDPYLLESNSEVTVNITSEAITFTPAIDTMKAALIFYPGALVDPEAYTPAARRIAEAGYKSVILKLPYRLAYFEYQQENVFKLTLDIIENDPKQRKWIVGGHSLGGKMATIFVRDHERSADGLLLAGTSHPREFDLSGITIDVTKIYGSEDGLASEEEIDQFAVNLPSDMHLVRIEGGNHRQFGNYGFQLGDGTAYISRKEQQGIMIEAMISQLQRVQNQ